MQKILEFSPLSSLPLFWVCPFVFVLFLKPTKKKIIQYYYVCVYVFIWALFYCPIIINYNNNNNSEYRARNSLSFVSFEKEKKRKKMPRNILTDWKRKGRFVENRPSSTEPVGYFREGSVSTDRIAEVDLSKE
jgi:hypothetical protein